MHRAAYLGLLLVVFARSIIVQFCYESLLHLFLVTSSPSLHDILLEFACACPWQQPNLFYLLWNHDFTYFLTFHPLNQFLAVYLRP